MWASASCGEPEYICSDGMPDSNWSIALREPLDSLQEHARLLRQEAPGYAGSQEFLNQNTDGAGNPLAGVYSRLEARELFKGFSTVELRTFF